MQSAIVKYKLIAELSNSFPDLIFSNPSIETTYNQEELIFLLESLIGQIVPQNLANVPQSQYAKSLVLKALGYDTTGIKYRSKLARSNNPKFVHQKIDIFKQQSRNLQVWGYAPYSSQKIKTVFDDLIETKYLDFNYIMVCHDDNGIINNIIIRKGSELDSWDKTKAKTIKFQATISQTLRSNIHNTIILGNNDFVLSTIPQIYTLSNKKDIIFETDKTSSTPTIKLIPSNPNLLYTLSELKFLLSPLIGCSLGFVDPNDTRIIGQTLEKKIAEQLGYVQTTQTDSGSFPDLMNQLIEVKFQSSPTIDLGKHIPESNEIVVSELNLTPKNTRYIVILTSISNNGEVYIDSIVITEGQDFFNFFTLWNSDDWKVQLTIPEEIYNR